MPAVRDTVFAQEAVTTDGGLTIPMCDYEAGDILLAFCTGDTGAPTWGCSNGVGTWNQLFAQNNSASTVCYWKYASSGEGDVVITASVAETYCGFLISVRDVFQGYTGGSPPVKNNVTKAASTRFLMPTLTTTTADSLILMFVGDTGANSSLMFAEGIGVTQSIMNGTAESCALGWFIKPTAGLTSATVYAGAVNTGAGVAAVIDIRAPAGGATTLPAYPASDDSSLLVINAGVAWDGSTALANTADTNFGTSVGGVTVNDATVTTGVVDVGVDPKGFISSAGVTNVASATAISGSNFIVPAAKYNIGDSNILGHIRSVTTVASQNLGALGTTRGVWFGMRSGATAGTNYKVWQIHGSDAPYYGVSVVPFVVNNADANTRALAGTLTNTDVRYYGYWTSGAGALTGQTILGPVWKMGTTVVAGGKVTEPVNIQGLEFCLTKGKVRWSSIRQGAKQLLCLQAVQFGNGGTNPLVLDLDATAIELPSRRNFDSKLVNYNGADNVIGFTYYAGASDTLKHRASVISSPSLYHWRIHASSSPSATYDFKGLSLIGAGDVQLRNVTTFSEMTFTSCPTITQNSATITDCVFSKSTVISATLADMDNISSCRFTSSGTGHAIQVSGAASTVTFYGNIFTGYAASNGSTGNEAIYVNIASGIVTINISGGTTPSIRTAGATVIVNNTVTLQLTGLVAGSDVVVKTSDTNTALANIDQNATSTYDFVYTYAPNTYVDIKIMKAGYVPYQVYDYLLSSSNSSLPIAQVVDRNYE